MNELELNSQFYNLMSTEDKGSFEINPENQRKYFTLKIDEFSELADKYKFIDVSNGGLIIGEKNNFTGGIFIIQPYFQKEKFQDKYFFLNQVQPWDYVTSSQSCKIHLNDFEKLEKSLDNLFTPDKLPEIPEDCKIIDTRNSEFTFLYLDPLKHMIFSKNTVLNNLERIIELDK